MPDQQAVQDDHPARGSILVVDDEPGVRTTLQAILGQDGYDVALASSARDALRLLEQRAFDVVVSDLYLGSGPGEDGLVVLAAAKARTPESYAVVLTGYGSVEAVIQALRGRVDDFLLKPSDVEDLKRVIARGVAQRRLAERAALAETHATLYHAERGARAAAELATARTAQLQAVAAALSAAATPEAVAEVIVRHLDQQGVSSGWIGLLSEDGRTILMGAAAKVPATSRSQWARIPLDADLPVTRALRSREPVWFQDWATMYAQYPAVGARSVVGTEACACLPLMARGAVSGALVVDFPVPKLFDAEERRHLETLAQLCAQAAERARLFEETEVARQRLSILASVGAVLGGSLDYERTLGEVARLAVPALADWCALDLLEPDGNLRRVATAHADGSREAIAQRLAKLFPTIAAGTAHTAQRVLGSGQPWMDADVSAERLAAEARSPEHLALLQELGFRGEIVVPLPGRERALGTLTLVAGETRRRYSEDDLGLAAEVGRRCALAVENARLYTELRERESRYRAVVEQSTDAIVVIEGTTTAYANAAYARLLGEPDAGSLIGRTGDAWVHPEDRDVVNQRALARQAGETIPPVYEFRVVRAGGEVRVVEVAATAIIQSGRAATLAILRDVTERKRAETAQRLLSDASRILGASLDYERTLAGVVRLLVPALAEWCTIYLKGSGDIERVAVAHRNSDGERLLHQLARRYPRRPEKPDPVIQVLDTGEARLVPYVSGEGLARYAEDPEHLRLLRLLDPRSSVIVPLVARGEVIGGIGLNRSGEAAPYGPDDLALARQLADRCAAAIDNARLYADAQAAVAARDRFLSIAAHELRTPLTAIKGHAQNLRRAARRGPVEQARLQRDLDLLNAGCDRLAALTEDLLDVGRLRSGQLALRFQPVDLAAFVQDVAARIAHGMDSRHRIVVEPGAGRSAEAAAETPAEEGGTPCTAHVDPAKLEQVLSNLLANAAKYSPSGGEIRVSMRPLQQPAPGSSDGTAMGVAVTVEDQGIGLPPGAAEQIFTPFNRAANATARNLPGMGLGLYVCRGIVERHGGWIRAESAGEGRGTAVTFWVPCEPARPDGSASWRRARG